MSLTGKPTSQTFDYIVVGGGTSGPAVARRLADGDPTAKVLLLEAGPTQDGVINSHIPLAWQNIIGSRYDWGYNTVPQKHINNRVINIPRAKFLGGCSGMNGTLMVRGPKADYDKWAAAGCDGWGWNDVLPYFRKCETFHPSPPISASSYHGDSGPVHTTVQSLAPISEALLQGFREKGTEWKPDMFSEGEGEGIGLAVRTVYKGIRTTGAAFVLPATLPANLAVLTSTTALRVIFSTTTSLRAVAVEAVSNAGDPTPFTIHARREIILSAGAYNTPSLLMHSGIGPRQHLAEVGIECKVDLKGVGENLQDHVITMQFYQARPGLTFDHLVYPPGMLDRAVAEWTKSQSGVTTRFPFGAFVYKRMNNIMKETEEWREAQAATGLEDPTGQLPTQPHIEYFSTELYGGGPQFTDLPTTEEHSAFAMIAMLCGPKSRGTVRLSSSDPHVPPVIDHAYFSSRLDHALVAEGMRFADSVVRDGTATKDRILGPWPPSAKLPAQHDPDGWREYAKERAGTCYHPCGTCKMGKADDAEAVVDPRLRVRGVEGLRIADCSIMPWLNNGHTQAPAYMIGEKCAVLILEDLKQLRSQNSASSSGRAPNRG